MTATYSKSIGYNCTLGLDFTGGTTYVVLVHVLNFGGSTAKTNFGDTTLLADQFQSFLPCLGVDPGSFDFVVGWDPNETAVYGALTAAQKTGQLIGANITVTYTPTGSPTTGVEPFKCYVEEVGRKLEKKDLTQCPIKLKITGSPGMGGS